MHLLHDTFDVYTLIRSLKRVYDENSGIPITQFNNQIDYNVIKAMLPYPVFGEEATVLPCTSNPKDSEGKFESSIEDYYAHSSGIDTYGFSLVTNTLCSTTQDLASQKKVYGKGCISSDGYGMTHQLESTYKPVISYPTPKFLKGNFIILVTDIINSLRNPCTIYDKNFKLKKNRLQEEEFSYQRFILTFVYLQNLVHIVLDKNLDDRNLTVNGIDSLDEIWYPLGHHVDLDIEDLLLVLSYNDMLEKLVTEKTCNIIGYSDINDLKDVLLVETINAVNMRYGIPSKALIEILENAKRLLDIARKHFNKAKSSLTLPEKYLVMWNILKEYNNIRKGE